MRILPIARPAFPVSLLVLLLCAGGLRADTVAIDFQLPLDTDPKTGKLKSLLKAKKATIPPQGPIQIEKLTIEYYEKGKVTLVATAPNCQYDKQNKVAISRAPVKIVRENAKVTGTGFKYVTGEQKFFIYHDVRVELRNIRKQSKVADGKGGKDGKKAKDPLAPGNAEQKEKKPDE